MLRIVSVSMGALLDMRSPDTGSLFISAYLKIVCLEISGIRIAAGGTVFVVSDQNVFVSQVTSVFRQAAVFQG